MVELRARYLLAEAQRRGILRFTKGGGAGGWGDDNEYGGGDVSRIAIGDAGVSDVSADPDEGDMGRTAGSGSSSGGGKGGGKRQQRRGSVASSRRDAAAAADDDAMTARSGGTKGSGSTKGSQVSGSRRGAGNFKVDENFLARVIDTKGAKANKAPMSVRAVVRLFEDGLAAFSSSALMELFAASFHGNVRSNRHLERVHLRQAAAKSDSSALDVQVRAANKQREPRHTLF